MTSPKYPSDEDFEIIEDMGSTEKMKIVHTTHDAAAGRSTCRPNSRTQRIKDYFSIRAHSQSIFKEEEEALIQQNPKLRERRVSETQVGNEPGICASFIKEHNELKRKQREKKIYEASTVHVGRANKKASAHSRKENDGKESAMPGKTSYGQLQEVSSRTEDTRDPTLKRVKKVGDLKGARLQANTEAKAHGDEYLKRMWAQREAIRDKNLEKVIPPSSSLRKPKYAPNYQNASPSKSTHTKSSSTSSKLTSYMGTSADLLDATRRDLTSNLRKSAEKAEKVLSSKFDQLGRYSSGHGNNWDDDSDSDESFYCIGERRLSELSKARRFSGTGTDPWTDGPQEECRLCRKPSPAGIRGLCRACESEFRRPQTTFLVDSDDEVKPPPPLKIKKIERACSNPQVTVGDISNPFSDENILTPKINQAEKKPRLVTPCDHISQQMYMDDGAHNTESGTQYVSRYERWQSADLRAQYQNQEHESSRWSPRLLEDDQVSAPLPSLRSKFNNVASLPAADGDTFALIAKENKQSDKTRTHNAKRNDSLYGYWDETSKEDEGRIAILAKRDNRYQRL